MLDCCAVTFIPSNEASHHSTVHISVNVHFNYMSMDCRFIGLIQSINLIMLSLILALRDFPNVLVVEATGINVTKLFKVVSRFLLPVSLSSLV